MIEGIEDGEQHKAPGKSSGGGDGAHTFHLPARQSSQEQTCFVSLLTPLAGQAPDQYARLGGDEQSFEDGATAFLLRLKNKDV